MAALNLPVPIRNWMPYMTQRYAHVADEQFEAMADGLTGTISTHAADDGQAAQNS
jgi:hypothetical protein